MNQLTVQIFSSDLFETFEHYKKAFNATQISLARGSENEPIHLEIDIMGNNIAIVDANFHATRHSFASRCIEAGVDAKTLSEMLGHASVNITLNRYVHSSLEQKREGINKLEQYSGK